MSSKLNKNYVSEIDQFLQAFDKQHPEPSLSQQAEIVKHLRVALLRDNKTEDSPTLTIWEDF